ncbi:cell wall protein [Streptomyces sp. NPDC050617]|uniref:cell wall protein n=1 Tax=Streptomyces sp. NPDC050617 TaxID=3154628 RepID=UPI003419A508
MTGLIWPVWRQHRTAYCVLLALAAFAAAWALWEHHALVTGVHDWAAGCPDATCGEPSAASGPADSAQIIQNEAHTALRYLPVAVSALIGAPLFAQDMENGTHRLAWTQSTSRTRWAAAKLAVAALLTAVAALLITAPVTWWWYTIRHGRDGSGALGAAWRAHAPQSDWSFLPYTGPAGIAHLLLGLVTGAAVGLLLRRLLPAVAVSATVTLGVQYALDQVRPHLLTATVTRRPVNVSPASPVNSWHLGQGYARTDGSLTDYVDPCPPSGWAAQLRCEQAHHISGSYSRYLRPSQLLPLQWLETGICLAAAALLTALCLYGVRLIRTR